MIIRPRVRGFICTTAHPLGCAANVQAQIARVRAAGRISPPLKNVLVIGASGGYGLASRICAAYAGGASTLGVSLEKEPRANKLGSAGWYNTLAFEDAARRDGLSAQSWNMDAFSDAAREEIIAAVHARGEPLDMVVYSLASPVRRDPHTGALWRSAIKPLHKPLHTRSLDVDNARVLDDVVLEPASSDDTAATVKVMGGEDWELWMDALLEAKVLSTGCRTLAYTYIGSELTWPIYWHGTLGKAKEDLDRAALAIRGRLAVLGGDARVTVLQAVVTQSSAAIPVVPLYVSLLFRVLKDLGLHEGPTAQIERLFRSRLDGDDRHLDEKGRIRMDEIELRSDVQERIKTLWPRITTENLLEKTDFAEFRASFLQIFGFGVAGIDYEQEVTPDWRPAP